MYVTSLSRPTDSLSSIIFPERVTSAVGRVDFPPMKRLYSASSVEYLSVLFTIAWPELFNVMVIRFVSKSVSILWLVRFIMRLTWRMAGFFFFSYADDESIEFTSASAALFQSAIFILSVDIREREPPASTYSAFEPHPDESIAAAAHRNDEIITSVFFIFISS